MQNQCRNPIHPLSSPFSVRPALDLIVHLIDPYFEVCIGLHGSHGRCSLLVILRLGLSEEVIFQLTELHYFGATDNSDFRARSVVLRNPRYLHEVPFIASLDLPYAFTLSRP